jgi:hypothetical protein
MEDDKELMILKELFGYTSKFYASLWGWHACDEVILKAKKVWFYYIPFKMNFKIMMF